MPWSLLSWLDWEWWPWVTVTWKGPEAGAASSLLQVELPGWASVSSWWSLLGVSLSFSQAPGKLTLSLPDERDRVQKKTFTKWVNKHLIKVGGTCFWGVTLTSCPLPRVSDSSPHTAVFLFHL